MFLASYARKGLPRDDMRVIEIGNFTTSTVIPAQAGIQAPSPRKWGSSSFNGSRALRANSKRSCVAFGDVYLWVADPRQVTFLCLSKEKSPKERTPRVAHRAHTARSPALLAKPGARLTRRARKTRLGLDQKARDYPRLRCGARFATRGPENQTVAGFCSPPVWRARASQPASGYSRAPCLSPSRVVCGWRVGARAEAGEKRRRFSRHPGCVSFGYFSLHKQRKVTCRGSATHKYASPKATRQKG